MYQGGNVGTIELDRSEPYLIADSLDALIVRWLDDCADRLDGLGPDGYTGTVAGYAWKIGYFREWWAETGPSVGWRLTRHELRNFERWLRMQKSKNTDEPLSYNTRRDGLRRLRSMLRWAQREQFLTNVAPADWVPAPAGDPPVRQPVEVGQLSALLAAAAQTSHPSRNVTILALLIGTGIRRQECAALDIEDVTFAEDGGGSVLVRLPKRTSRGLVVREPAFDPATGDYLTRWLTGQGKSSGPLFPSSRGGGHLTPMALGRMVRRCWSAAGLSPDQPVHSLRYAFITHWRRRHKGEDLEDLLRYQVGHATSQMTSQYNLQGVDDLRTTVDSPMSAIGVRVEDWPGLGAA